MSGLEGALCRGQGPLFESTHPLDHEEAAAICAKCPAIAACRGLLEAESKNAVYGATGTWAGELVGTKRAERTREHGTEKGYWQHKNRGEDACSECLEGYRFTEWFRKRYGEAV